MRVLLATEKVRGRGSVMHFERPLNSLWTGALGGRFLGGAQISCK